MTDFAKHQADLRASNLGSINYANRAPLCCHEGIETEHVVKPSRLCWLVWPALMIGLGVAAAVFGIARASEPPRQWVIWNTAANEQFHPHRFTSATACAVDIGHVKDGSGKKLACVKKPN